MRIMICLIDDDKFYHVFTKRLLESMPHKVKEVLQFYDITSAIKYFEENSSDDQKIPDVIFLDLNLPDFSGWDFLNELEKMNFEKNPVIHICSSSVSPEDVEKARDEARVDRYIVKPLKREHIQQVLQEYFEFTNN